jgi:hypothetical protein
MCLYWTLLFKASDAAGWTSVHWWLDVSVHGVAATTMLVDLALGANRPHPQHVALLAAIGAVYCVVNAAVSTTVAILYPVLTWRDGSSAVLVIGALVAVVAIFAGLGAAAWARDRLATRVGAAAKAGGAPLAATPSGAWAGAAFPTLPLLVGGAEGASQLVDDGRGLRESACVGGCGRGSTTQRRAAAAEGGVGRALLAEAGEGEDGLQLQHGDAEGMFPL